MGLPNYYLVRVLSECLHNYTKYKGEIVIKSSNQIEMF